jgi:hypothetical protein
MKKMLIIAAAACVGLVTVLNAAFDHVQAESRAGVATFEAAVESMQ